MSESNLSGHMCTVTAANPLLQLLFSTLGHLRKQSANRERQKQQDLQSNDLKSAFQPFWTCDHRGQVNKTPVTQVWGLIHHHLAVTGQGKMSIPQLGGSDCWRLQLLGKWLLKSQLRQPSSDRSVTPWQPPVAREKCIPQPATEKWKMWHKL